VSQAEPEASPFQPGAEVGGFRLMRLLGRGGMGLIYLARDTRLGRRVAFKVVDPARLGSPELVGRFLTEARAMARLSHPHIAQIYAAGEHQGSPYLAIEYLEGQALRERVREDPILPVVGPSGAGKSSFVQAGVIPRLREQSLWIVLQLSPGRDPLRNLAARLLREVWRRVPVAWERGLAVRRGAPPDHRCSAP